ncbi:MAG: GTPase Era [Armatimonadetes bacterium]|nr:GTPase Era [Armatimonadota bacterium]
MAFRFGTVAMIGKPNVGKSTLVNALVGQKVSIVSPKPQTTRRRVLGIAQGDDYQIAFIDTPGIHEPHTRLGRAMVNQARSAMGDIDLLVFVVDGGGLPDDIDKSIGKQVLAAGQPCLLVINKMDHLKAENVIETVEAYSKLCNPVEVMMTTATRGINLDKLQEMILSRIPEGEPLFGEDEFTDQSSRFMTAEFVREKILLATRQEVPHAVAVRILEWEDGPERTIILAEILVEKPSQRGILIGKGGQFLKKIGSEARPEIEELVDRPVYLELHVKVQEGWRMNPRVIHELEYDSES